MQAPRRSRGDVETASDGAGDESDDEEGDEEDVGDDGECVRGRGREGTICGLSEHCGEGDQTLPRVLIATIRRNRNPRWHPLRQLNQHQIYRSGGTR